MPDDVVAAIRARAAAAGMSVSEYLRAEPTRDVARPTLSEVMARAQARPGGASGEAIVRVIREARDNPKPR